MTLDDLNHMDSSSAEAEFARCCGSSRWAAAMAAARPFRNFGAMKQRGDEIWASLGRADWLEAFAAHPRIGEAPPASPSSAWSTEEQLGMESARDDVKARLAALNVEYEARFGYIFIVCAAGKAPGEMLALLRWRMTNDPEQELPIAAGEQRKITGLRLARLVDAHT